MERVTTVKGYHIDLWRRHQPVLDELLATRSDPDITNIAQAVEGNGSAWIWAIRDALAAVPWGQGACWYGYMRSANLMAGGVFNYGRFLQVVVNSGQDSDWNNARVKRDIFEAKIRAVPALFQTTVTCLEGCGPAPTELPLGVLP